VLEGGGIDRGEGGIIGGMEGGERLVKIRKVNIGGGKWGRKEKEEERLDRG
jgi:hypothetical protein